VREAGQAVSYLVGEPFAEFGDAGGDALGPAFLPFRGGLRRLDRIGRARGSA